LKSTVKYPCLMIPVIYYNHSVYVIYKYIYIQFCSFDSKDDVAVSQSMHNIVYLAFSLAKLDSEVDD
jgi:hypothetical protein